jgi:hypothetical protein
MKELVKIVLAVLIGAALGHWYTTVEARLADHEAHLKFNDQMIQRSMQLGSPRMGILP